MEPIRKHHLLNTILINLYLYFQNLPNSGCISIVKRKWLFQSQTHGSALLSLKIKVAQANIGECKMYYSKYNTYGVHPLYCFSQHHCPLHGQGQMVHMSTVISYPCRCLILVAHSINLSRLPIW